MQIITTADFVNNAERYLKMVSKEEIWITRDDKTIARLVAPEKTNAVEAISGILKGKIPDDTDRNSIKEERLGKLCD